MSLQEIKAPAHVAIFSYVGDVQGCGTIRVIYPSLLLNQYRINQYAFTAMYSSMFVNDPKFYKPYSFVQFQRSATKQHYEIFNHYLNHIRAQNRTPLIYEIDDMLFGIPEWNYAHSYYKPNDDVIKKMMGMVDGMITSTEKLKEVYSPFAKKVTVIPNHLPKFVWGEPIPKLEKNPRQLKDRPRIGWAGSENHFAHPMTKEYKEGIRGGDFNDKLIDFIRKTADKYQWVLSGAKPVEVNDLIQEGKIEFHGWKSTFEYPRHIKSLDLDICLAPLMPCEFNDCKCLVGSTLIITENGIKTIDNVEKANKIWQENSYENINHKFKYENKKTIKLTTKKGFEIEGTLNHKLRSNNNFIKMSDLKIGDKLDLNFFDFPNVDYQKISAPLFLTKKLNNIDFTKLEDDLLPKIIINERWSRFIGYMIGDGNIGQSDSINFSCSIADIDFINDIKLFCNQIGINYLIKNSKLGKGVTIIIYSRNLKWILSEKIGIGGSGEKKNLIVPEVIFQSPKSVIKEFISGLFETDGTVSNSNCNFVTKSKKLAQQIQFLLMGFGIVSDLKTRYNKIYNKPYYNITLYRHASEIFYNEINFISDRKRKLLERNISKKHSNAYRPMCLFDEIVSIEYSNNDVYDIDVDNHYYNANCIVSHNSNIKSLEFAVIGVPGVYSSARPYLDMALNTNDEDEFIANIEMLASDIDKRKEIYYTDFETVKKQIYWEEYDNLFHYINSYLTMFGKTLKLP